MDLLLVIVAVGCALAGLWWGALRMLAALAATVAAVAAGRWVAPAAVSLLVGSGSVSPGLRIGAIVGSALVAGVLVLIAARGLRKGLEVLRLGWLDRLAGMVVSGGLACLVLSLLLALAAVGGHPPRTPFATFLTAAGQTLLAAHSTPVSSSSPSTTPATPTSSGQQPR
ncbi:MAG: CvpA family protein [Thermoanaerobaculaceae bacterium]|jgi:uncharacterized membrane protein required for colicin V production|nr:CvpA family protein [Thermoanaerobaculaceae bacterium]